MPTPSTASKQDVEARGRVMGLCAEARADELDAALARLRPIPALSDLREPERGLVMLRGRAGGEGAAFNLGEASVVRAAVLVAGIGTGFAYHLGRDRARARTAAILDALWQAPERRQAVEAALEPVRRRLAVERREAARRTAATRVNFFTMVRGEG